MSDFYRFPHIPHIAWLGEGVPRDDKVLTRELVNNLFSSEVVIEEKLDGANLGISFSQEGELRAQNRGQYLTQPYCGQFSRLNNWLETHRNVLFSELPKPSILFGEWCAAKHSLEYDRLPDWFVVFDVYDIYAKKFWSTLRRNTLARALRLPTVPELYVGKLNPDDLSFFLENSRSRYRSGPPEGVVIRQETQDWLQARAKLVGPEFIQSIAEHWRNRVIQWNRVDVISQYS